MKKSINLASIHFTELIVNAQAGDQDAFAELVKRFQGMVYIVADNMVNEARLAEDITQETFLEAYLQLHQLREPRAFPAWLRRITVKQVDRVLRKKILPVVEMDDGLTIDPYMPDPALAFERIEARRSLKDAIYHLPKIYRIPVVLFYIQGYDQQTISDFLGLPVGTVKKRLSDAREKLKDLIVMQQNTTSTNDVTQRVEFFIALKTNDMPRIQRLVSNTPELLEVPTVWGDVSDGYYFPIGINAIIWSAITGNLDLLTYFQSQGADIAQVQKGTASRTLLYAIELQQVEMVRYLLEQGVSANGQSYGDLTPLHQSVVVGNTDVMQLLLDYDADLTAVDKFGRTPADWAVLKQNEAVYSVLAKTGFAMPRMTEESPPISEASRKLPVGTDLLGLNLDSQGDIYGSGNLAEKTLWWNVQADTQSPILQTGIKIVDFLAPLKRGGHNGIFTPLPGVGKLVLMGEIIKNLAVLRDAYVISVMVEEGPATAENFMLGWRAMNVYQRMVNIAVQENDGVKQKLDAVQTAFTHADYFRQAGHEVVLLIESKLLMEKSIQDYLRNNPVITPASAITVIYHGEHTPEAHPEFFGDLDTLITFNKDRAKAGLWPAVDPLRSYANTLSGHENHADLRQQVQTLLRRYQDLGLDGNGYIASEDEQIMIERVERLNRFLTQPFTIAEMYTANPGLMVLLENTLAGITAILAGKLDDTPAADLYFIGAVK